MAGGLQSGDPTRATVQWTARFLSLLVVGTVVAMFVGTGGVAPAQLTSLEAWLMGAFAVAWLGLLVGWRQEVVGGAMTCGGIALFFLIHRIASGDFPRGWAFGLIALPGLLFLWSACRVRPTRGTDGRSLIHE
jgi:hypothetical protein